MTTLKDKVALVTGASGGIGEAIATRLHSLGAQVVLTGRRKDALDALADKLGAGAHAVAADLSQRAAIKQLVKDAEAATSGAIDILINNAGHTKDNLAMRLSDEAWDEVIEVDLTAAFLLTRECLRGMIKKRWGRVVSITSIVGEMGNPGQANYAAAKAGLTAMSKSIAKEVANRGITFNSIAPGFIETAMTDSLNEKQREGLFSTIPMARFGAPADIAAAAAFLASDDAAYITGQTIHVNGGMAMP